MVVADYEITIDGELSAELATAFAPHRVTAGDGQSIIVAERIDRAGLLALLARVGEISVSIVRVERSSPTVPTP